MKVLIVGTGSIGERHLRCFVSTGRAAVAICETNQSLREQIAAKYNVPAFSSIADAIPTKFDAAVIATPAHTHLPIALQLANAAVHILIEKPLSTDLAGVDELLRAVHQKSLVAAVAYVYRAHPLFRAFHDAVVSGEFGKPLQVTAIAGQHFPTFRPAYRDIYYNNHRTGGGAIQDALTHVMNYVEWLVGPATQVVADAAHLALDGVTVEDMAHVLAKHGNVLCSFALNQFQPANENSITVVCERGMLRLELQNSRWRSMIEPNSTWTDHPLAAVERDEPFTRQAHAFLDAIEKTTPPLCSLTQGIQTLRMNLATMRSSQSHQWVDLQNGQP